MSALTEYQTIKIHGHPAFVLVPWEEFRRIQPMLAGERAKQSGIPQAVAEAHVLHDVPLIRAWREHLGLTQEEVADRAGISQAAVAKLERPEARPRMATLKKIAAAMGISPEHLVI